MNKKTLYWIIGISLPLLILCGCISGFGLLLYNATSGSDGPSFGDAVAIIRVEGVIQAGESPADIFGGTAEGAYSDRIVRQLKHADADSDVKAIVLRVDSPGGGVVASDEIYEQVAQMTKPVIVSMGTMAASGGYYVSVPADEIWANRHTLTGSIGVIIQFVNIQGFAEEYGIEATTISSGANKDTGSLFRGLRPEEEAIWQAIIDQSYDVFVQIIADGRNLDKAAVRELADGRVYTGQQALDLELVDNLGNLSQVVQRAAELGEIDGRPRVIDYGTYAPLFGGVWGTFNRPSPAQELQKLLHLDVSPGLMYLYTGN